MLQLTQSIFGTLWICTILFQLTLEDSIKPNMSTYNKLVILSFDGFRYDYMGKTATPSLDAIKSAGVHSLYMKPQMITKTFANHQSIATGHYTESHGIVDRDVFDPLYGFLKGTEENNSKFWNFRPDVVPAWTLNEMAGKGRHSGVQWPGCEVPYGASLILPTHYLPFSKTRTFEARVDYIISWLTNSSKPANLVYMYFDEPDDTGHVYGPESSQMLTAIKRVDDVVGYLVAKLKVLKILDDINLIVLSDHGLKEVSVDNMINITSLMNISYYKAIGHTPVWHIAPISGKTDLVYNTLKNASRSKPFSVYKKSELLPEWHYGNNRRVGPIVILADSGYVFEDFIGIPGRKYGIHGYDDRDPSMRAFFIAQGPAFKKGVQINAIENVDVFPLVCKLMNFTPGPNNGTLKFIGEMLK